MVGLDENRANKPAAQWTIQDIDALIVPEEGAYLEFKKATEFLANGKFVRSILIEELVETASAFLNADGGIQAKPWPAKCK